MDKKENRKLRNDLISALITHITIEILDGNKRMGNITVAENSPPLSYNDLEAVALGVDKEADYEVSVAPSLDNACYKWSIM